MKIPKKPIDVQELLRKDSPGVFTLLKNEEVMAFVAQCNKKYLHWDELRYKKIPGGAKPEYVWALLKLFRIGQYRLMHFGKYHFQYVLLDEFQKKLHLLDKGAGGRLASPLDSIPVNGREQYIISSLMEEAIASSQLEGAATTRKIAKELLRFKKKPRNYSEQMIVNGYRTIQKITRMKERTLTPEMLLDLHKEITENTLKDRRYEGNFRDTDDVVVGDPPHAEKIYYQPPAHKDLPKLIETYCAFANTEDDEFIHPILKGIILHFLMGYIHPFEDGNGRTARTVFYWYVLTRGYWLFEFMSISRILLRSKIKYGMSYLYTETDDNDLTYFLDYNLRAIEEALHDMERYIARKQREQAEAITLIKGIKDINLRQAQILKEFMKDPDKSFVIAEVMNTYGVAYDTARNDLLHLVELGHVEKMRIQKKFIFKLSEDTHISE